MVIGFGRGIIVLHDGSWWKLTDPIPDLPRIEVCGRRIVNVQVARRGLELTLNRPTAARDVKLYLDWLDKDGELIQPQFPIPSQPKAAIPGPEDPILKELDESFDRIESILRGEPWDGTNNSER